MSVTPSNASYIHQRGELRNAILAAIETLDDHTGITRRQISLEVSKLCPSTPGQFGSALQASTGRESSVILKVMHPKTSSFLYGLKEWPDFVELVEKYNVENQNMLDSMSDARRAKFEDDHFEEDNDENQSDANSQEEESPSKTEASATNEPSPEVPRRKFRIAEAELAILEAEYKKGRRPSIPRMKELAEELGCRHYRTISKWFLNRWAKDSIAKEDLARARGKAQNINDGDSIDNAFSDSEGSVSGNGNGTRDEGNPDHIPRTQEAKPVPSTCRGVTITSSGRYLARLAHEGQRFNLGVFSTAEEAAKAYNDKARELGLPPPIRRAPVKSEVTASLQPTRRASTSKKAPATVDEIVDHIIYALQSPSHTFITRSQVWAQFNCNCTREDFNQALVGAIKDGSSGIMRKQDKERKIWVYGLKTWMTKKEGKDTSATTQATVPSRAVQESRNKRPLSPRKGVSGDLVPKKFRVADWEDELLAAYKKNPNPTTADLRELAAEVQCQQTRTLNKWFMRKREEERIAKEQSEEAADNGEADSAKRKPEEDVDEGNVSPKKARTESTSAADVNGDSDDNETASPSRKRSASDDESETETASPSKSRESESKEVETPKFNQKWSKSTAVDELDALRRENRVQEITKADMQQLHEKHTPITTTVA